MLGCAETAALLRQWDRVLVLSHASPDGDTLGSAAALVRGLLALGKRAAFRCADPIPPKFNYLFQGLPNEVLDGTMAPLHILSVDVADLPLLGSVSQEYAGRIELAIDHHGTHKPFAQERWVEADSAAAAEMIWLLLKEMGIVPDRAMADCAYTGMCTDTGCFRYRNATPRTHRLAAEAMEAGADAGEINRVMFECKSRAQAEAESRILNAMEFFCGGQCAMVRIPWKLYEEKGLAESDLEGVAALPRQIEGVLIGVTLKEKENGLVKASVRTNPGADAAELCGRFGGGGHQGAAGCSFPGKTLEQAAEELRRACAEYLKDRQP